MLSIRARPLEAVAARIDALELNLVVRERGHYEVSGRSHPLPAGTALFIAPATDHEKELRAATVISDDAIKAAAAGATDFEITDAGLLIPIDEERLIEAVYVAPHAPAGVAERARAALDRVGLQSIPVLPSRLMEQPIY